MIMEYSYINVFIFRWAAIKLHYLNRVCRAYQTDLISIVFGTNMLIVNISIYNLIIIYHLFSPVNAARSYEGFYEQTFKLL